MEALSVVGVGVVAEAVAGVETEAVSVGWRGGGLEERVMSGEAAEAWWRRCTWNR